MSESGEEEVKGPVSPGYRKALWIVVALNGGYGVLEGIAGFLARSESLKADSLDFLGDGLITGIGLLVVNAEARTRAKSALGQGIFLGALGLGVIGSTVYRLLVHAPPEAEIMGAVGAVALVINLAAAAILIPHRHGDASVKAVWLFSRNDAIGNLAVVVAAGLVALTRTAWPDLVAASVVAGLFLQSAVSIIRDARAELREPNPAESQ